MNHRAWCEPRRDAGSSQAETTGWNPWQPRPGCVWNRPWKPRPNQKDMCVPATRKILYITSGDMLGLGKHLETVQVALQFRAGTRPSSSTGARHGPVTAEKDTRIRICSSIRPGAMLLG